MDVRQSLVLGIIQGLTEFIPVSSTAHLILAPELLGIAPPRADIAHTYDTVIQFGTVIPVLIYFWRDWLKMLAAAGRILGRKAKGDIDERMVKYLFFGSIPAGIAGLIAEKLDVLKSLADPGHNHGAYLAIGSALVVVGLLMWWAEASSSKSRDVEHIGMPDAILMGCAQAVAIWPGVSRSGATITAGLFSGLTREAAARFSFLLMAPIMFAATGLKLVKVLLGSEQLTSGEWSGILLATAVAAVTGYFAIAFLLGWLQKRSLGVFAVYRVVLGAFVIGLYFVQK